MPIEGEARRQTGSWRWVAVLGGLLLLATTLWLYWRHRERELLPPPGDRSEERKLSDMDPEEEQPVEGEVEPNIVPGEGIEDEGQVMGRPAMMPDPASMEAGYELHDVDAGAAIKPFIWFFVFMAVVAGIVTGFQVLLTGRIDDLLPPEQGIAEPPQNPVPDAIESRAATGNEYAEMRAEHDAILSSYGWVDEEAGVVRIPIERAMELLVEEGLPVREGDQTSETEFMTPLQSSSGRRMERAQEWIYADSPR